ncbi:DUF262 domain-containing protein [Demequina mangrovi]|uniref:GmrSD restriction endonucleases N-terminal domain-containing protein n=1 Tax=Demequina mangrovi TaxID=1043493 RepID=A0A1H6ZDW5_9MICO|nr:DUF262 domain-containing protein [Demequina mangrovi]SEJ51591.1 Protein of unknown function DUF262 [Demequina mangrovi]
MGYMPQTTVADTLLRVQKQELILPAIQREYVWRPGQIIRLFDSLMRGYPIGGFLSWKVEPATAAQFRFYGFMKNYNELSNRHNPVADLAPGQPATAVLDGQQRLTSLNIGLRGSFAQRRKWGRYSDAGAYPETRLFLHAGREAEHNDDGLVYDFRFFSDAALESIDVAERPYWFPVSKIYDARTQFEAFQLASSQGLGNDEAVVERLGKLWHVVHVEPLVNMFEETEQDIERVLDIFIRVNSGGTVLSYSDLLLSIATAQWKERDAREAVHGLVDRLNAVGQGFSFSKDLVLKSGLMLTDVNDISFKVKNFTSENMAVLDDQWDRVGDSLELAVGLLSDFGLSDATLTADSVVIPIAYYLHRREATQKYREAPSETGDREAIRKWVLRSLVASGIWGSGLDSLLRDLRDVIKLHGAESFPEEELERRMAARGKSLHPTPDRVDELLSRTYGGRSTFALLAVLFPHVDTRNVHHVDHVFPAALLSRKALRSAGLDDAAVERIEAKRDQLANLQLLEGLVNIAKSDKDPESWSRTQYPDPVAHDAYRARNRLPDLPTSVHEFEEFFDARRGLLSRALGEALGVVDSQSGD